MSGILEDYGIDVSEYDVPSWDIDDGTYEFTVGDVFVKEGSNNNPDKSWIIIEYLVGEDGKRYSELYELPKDAAQPTEDEKKRLGRYKGRLLSLGIAPEDVNTVSREDLVGIAGTFQLRTTQGTKGGTFQNIRNLKLADNGTNEFKQAATQEAEAPVSEAPKRQPAARKAPASSKPATTVDNPFAKKG